MRTPLLTDMDEIRRMTEDLAEKERQKFQDNSDQGNSQNQELKDPIGNVTFNSRSIIFLGNRSQERGFFPNKDSQEKSSLR